MPNGQVKKAAYLYRGALMLTVIKIALALHFIPQKFSLGSSLVTKSGHRTTEIVTELSDFTLLHHFTQ
jgi:hypothetical protein